MTEGKATRTFCGEARRFYREVVLTYDGDDCLIWPYMRDAKGYGRMKVDGRMSLVSRRVCEEINGQAPTPKHEAAHSCGNGHLACATKGHLSWKTRAENCADKLIHGTHDRGERNSQAKLTEAQAREVLALKGKETHRSIAERFGIARQTVTRIQSGNGWAWLSDATA